MELKDNPLLQPENYRADYQASIENFKNNPELVAFDKLCYELFSMNEMGKTFLELVQKRYLVPSLVARESPNYTELLCWADGFKDFIRLIIQSVMSHEQRIKAETNK